ncbi:MAG TPA: NADH-quinone oxidoreductase subunit NuoE [Bacteroidota bacterium]|nr:NADH-quinone oxidoreductase subunit NuoE [Bacteroidota bacterium]
MPMFTEEELQQVQEIRSHYPTNLAAVMGVLHMVQDKYGYISDEAITSVAKLLDIPEENVLGVVTFYEMYHQHPTGKYKLQVCTNVSCLLCGSDMVLKTIKDKIGIGIGETTADGLFSVHEVECLGSCGTAPVVSVNKEYHEKLTPESINALIDNLKARA